MTEIMRITRKRFAEIDELLLREHINKHDQPHQLRTAVNASSTLRQMGASHRDIMRAAVGGLIHDIGYIDPDEVPEEAAHDDYHGGNNRKFKKHARKGATEARRVLTQMLQTVRSQDDANPSLKKLISYKDENGQDQLMDEEDIERIAEAILNHNDYGKDGDYDARTISTSALMVQLFDKLDICKGRVYKEHMEPDAFMPGSEEFDQRYYHRSVPFCVQSYDYELDEKRGVMDMTYHVDLSEFRELMRAKYPDFEYTEEDFTHDFKRAYAKNCQIAAEAVSVILDNVNGGPTLRVELVFADNGRKAMAFSRPNRDVYKREAGLLRVSIGEMLQSDLGN